MAVPYDYDGAEKFLFSSNTVAYDFKGFSKDEEVAKITNAVVKMTNNFTWIRMRLTLRSP